MNRQILDVEALGTNLDLCRFIRAVHPGDAQLQAALLYLIASANELQTVALDEMAAAHNVTVWTAGRWVKTLADKKILMLRRLDPSLTQLAPGPVLIAKGWTENAPECPRTITPPPEPKRAPSALPEPSAPVSRPQKQAPRDLNSIKTARFKSACDASDACETLLARLGDHREPLHETLRGIISNPLFDRLDLTRELFNADAWLSGSGRRYTDIHRFLMSWVRRSVSKKPATNANSVPEGKYEKLASQAKGK